MKKKSENMIRLDKYVVCIFSNRDGEFVARRPISKGLKAKNIKLAVRARDHYAPECAPHSAVLGTETVWIEKVMAP